MKNLKNLREIIIDLREIYATGNISYDKMLNLMELNGDFLSKSTLSRLFGDDWEKYNFNYETTIRPIAKVLLDIETIEDTDDLDRKAMKSLLKYKIERIEELEATVKELTNTLNKEKVKYHERLDKEREQSRRSIEFLKEQVSLKDKRMDILLQAIFDKDVQQKEMLAKILQCSKCEVRNEQAR